MEAVLMMAPERPAAIRRDLQTGLVQPHAGIVHQHIQMIQQCFRLTQRRRHIYRIRHITTDSAGSHIVQPPDFFRRSLCPGKRDIQKSDVRPGCSHTVAHGPANTTGAAGNNNRFSIQRKKPLNAYFFHGACSRSYSMLLITSTPARVPMRLAPAWSRSIANL